MNMNKVDRPYTIKAVVNLATIIIDLLGMIQPKMFLRISFPVIQIIFMVNTVKWVIRNRRNHCNYFSKPIWDYYKPDSKSHQQ